MIFVIVIILIITLIKPFLCLSQQPLLSWIQQWTLGLKIIKKVQICCQVYENSLYPCTGLHPTLQTWQHYTEEEGGKKGSCLVEFTPKLNPGVQIVVGPFNVGIYYLDPPPSYSIFCRVSSNGWVFLKHTSVGIVFKMLQQQLLSKRERFS